MEEEMRKNWSGAKFRPSDPAMMSDIFMEKRLTALQSLARRYRRFSNIALLSVAWCALFAFNRHIGDDAMRYFVTIFGCVYFLIASVMDRWLYHGVSRIDCATMSVAEVSRLALFYRRRHLQFIVVLLPMAVVFIGSVVYASTRNDWFIAGIVGGSIFGLAIGIRQLLKFMNSYRDLTAQE